MIIVRLKMRLKTNLQFIIIKMIIRMFEMCFVALFDFKNIGIDTITMSIGVLTSQVIGKNVFRGGHFNFFIFEQEPLE